MQRKHKNHRYISGEWYDDQYSTPGSRYHDCYVKDEEPIIYAKQCNWYYSYLIAAALGVRPNAKILDLGSGVGMFIQSWIDNGFTNIQGIEISKEAIKHSKIPERLTHGSVEDMSMFKDKEFDLVFSSAFFEHVDESILEQSIKECHRIGKKQAHLIDLPGKVHPEGVDTDPSHITMIPMSEWLNLFMKHTDQMVMKIDDLIAGEYPIVAVLDNNDMHYPLISCIRRQYDKHERVQKRQPEKVSAIQL
jgi:ubiquinone/menaquinone biosynthesis C-methylase UbiE